MRGDPNYNAVPPGGYTDEAPCDDGCRFEAKCGRTPIECGENYESLSDWAVDMAIEEARLRRKERQ